LTPRLLLVLGGTRSGKSRFARERAGASRSVLFLATGVATDEDMATRIARHQAERPRDWTTLEARYDLRKSLTDAWHGERCLLLDDFASMVSNLLVERAAAEDDVLAEVLELLDFVRYHSVELIVVSSEVGSGVVPDARLGRQFRDLLGIANQSLASAADEVVLLVAGLPLRLKG
jgi:adenosylcobinamide kinase / adenosylcobinamide-phosphate guanylyltransferase